MYWWAFLILFTLTACGDSESHNAAPQASFGEQLADDVLFAAQSPFVDIGIKRDPIPEKLLAIENKPYARLMFHTCDDFTREITELDAILGPDIDATFLQPPTSDTGSYLLEGGEIARSGASSLVVSKVSFLPFKGVVRRISGAEIRPGCLGFKQ